MKPISWIFLVSCLLLFWTTALAQSQDTPRLVLLESVHDFGEVREGEVLEHSFPIHNRGKAPLTIKDVKPG